MISQRAKKLDPYVPGEQPKDREYIKLNANENPYPPSPKVIEALSNLITHKSISLALYPDPDSNELRSSIARSLNESSGVLGTMGAENTSSLSITPDMIFCGNGSDEVLSVLFYSFFNADTSLIAPEHSYSFYPVYCGYYGIPLNKIPLKSDFTLDTDAMINAADAGCSGLIFANPNAPTSLALSVEKIRQMLKSFPSDKIFVVDEAYTDFSDESALILLTEFKNLVIVRTFSKSFSFAGMRLGYAVAHPELVEVMTRVKNSFNHFPVDIAAQTAGIAACSDIAYYAENAKKIIAQRNSFIDFLRSRGWMCYSSKTNFVLARKEGISGKEVYESVKKDGILVRHFNTPLITDYVRISIGNSEQMTALKNILQKI